MRCVRRGVESCAPYTATELHKSAAVKSPLGAQTVLGDRHDLVCENFVASAVGGPAELARENFPTAGHARCSATETATETSMYERQEVRPAAFT